MAQQETAIWTKRFPLQASLFSNKSIIGEVHANIYVNRYCILQKIANITSSFFFLSSSVALTLVLLASVMRATAKRLAACKSPEANIFPTWSVEF